MTSQRKYPNDGRFSRNFKWIINPVRQQSQKIKQKRINLTHKNEQKGGR